MLVLLPKGIKLWGGMSRSVVEYNKPESIRVGLNEYFQVSGYLLMTFALMNGVQTFTGGEDETAKQRVPGIIVAG